jgi:hypothetical protein
VEVEILIWRLAKASMRKPDLCPVVCDLKQELPYPEVQVITWYITWPDGTVESLE